MIPTDASICPICNENLQSQPQPPFARSKWDKLKIGALIGAVLVLGLVIVLHFFLFADYTIDARRLRIRDDLYYKGGEKRPFTGVAVDSNGMDYHRFKNGKLHGTAQQFYPNGMEKITQHFSNGFLNGEQYAYYPDGKLSSKKNYRNGKSHGEQLYYNQAGKLIARETYQDGVLHGEQMHSFDNSEQVWKTENYKNGVLYEMIEYYRNGKIYQSENRRDDNSVEHLGYYEDGKPAYKINSHNGAASPGSSWWDQQGRLTERIIVGPNNQVADETYTYHPNGKIAKIERLLHSSRTRHGDQEEYFENGKLKMKASFLLDKLGEMTLYNQDGTIKDRKSVV